MQRDPKTGVPLIGARDMRPIKVKLVQKDGTLSIEDQETGRPILDVAHVRYEAGPRGAQLALTIAGPSLEAIFDEHALVVRQPAQIVDLQGKNAPLFDGEEIPIYDKDGNPYAVAKVELLKKQEAKSAS